MTDPRTPETKEAQLPDALDQNPGAAEPATGRKGSEDAQLLAEADVERETAPEGSAATNA